MITLKSFAEEVPVSNLRQVQRFLVLEDKGGRQLRIPVSEEAILQVASFMKESPAPLPTPGDSVDDENPPPIEEFGGDADGTLSEEPMVVTEDSPYEEPPQYESPMTEDGIQSL